MWEIQYHKEALLDLKKLDQSQRNQVKKKIRQVAENPLPRNEGGYGDPLSSKSSTQLSDYCKNKLVKAGLRVVYRLVIENNVMRIIVVSARADDEVYQIAHKRKQKY